MSDDSKTSIPEPTSNQSYSSDSYGIKPEFGAPITSWVKGGSSTGAWDRHIAETEADAEMRRNRQDAERRAASKPIEEGGAQLMSHHFGHPKDDPKVMVTFVNSKKEREFEILCDVMVEDQGTELAFVFVCPDCVSRGVPSGQAQLRVSDRNKKWSLDQRTVGTPIRWENPDGSSEIFYSAGVIMDTEILRCPNAHCTLCVKIHNNMMYRV